MPGCIITLQQMMKVMMMKLMKLNFDINMKVFVLVD